MPDDRTPPVSIFGNLPKPPVRETPQPPPFQVPLADLGAELNRISTTLAQATPDTFEEVMNAIMPGLEPLLNASAVAISERIAAVQQVHPLLAEALSAVVMRIELQRYLTIFTLDPVALCPAMAQARAEAEAHADDDDDDPTGGPHNDD